jgi:HK97 family phage portal protein
MIFDMFTKSTTISTSQQLAEFLGSGVNSAAGVRVTADTAMGYAAVFSCVRVLAESIGQLPLHLYSRDDKGESKKVTGHPLYPLLHDAPNDYQTAQEFREMEVAHLCLRGNFYAFINRVGDRVLELLPFSPDAVKPKLTEEHEAVYEVTFANGAQDVLDAEQVYHSRLFSLDGVAGVSPIRYARDAIGLGIATQKHGSRLFSNGAKPGGVLSTTNVLKDDTHKRIKESWNEAHQGEANAHKVAILEAGLTWTQVGMSAEDSQFLETRKFQRSEIAGMFRVPPHMIGDLQNATFSNIEHQGLEFVQFSLMPYLTRIEQRIKKSLLRPQERATHYPKFNANGLLRGDMKSRSDFYIRLQQTGSLSPNEIRALEDMNPRDGGDIYLTPLNMAIDGKPIGEPKNEN